MHTTKTIKVSNYEKLENIFDTYNNVFQIKSYILKNETRQTFEIIFRHPENTKIQTVLKEFKKLLNN